MGLRVPRWAAVVAVVLVAVPGSALVGSAPSSPSRSPTGLLPSLAPPTASFAGPPSTVRTVAAAYHPTSGTTVVGALSPSTPLDVLVGLSPSDPSGLAAYVTGENVPGSSTYRAFLSPGEVGGRYGPSPSAVDGVRQYFSGYGLSSHPLPGGFLLDLRGPSGALGRAFGTTFEEFRDSTGRLFVSHLTAATLPVGLAVTGAYGLGDANPFRPFARAEAPTHLDPVPLAACTPGANGALSPCEVQTAYSSAAGLASGTNGTGERIGIVDAYDGGEPQNQLATDFSLFTGGFGLPSGQVSYAYPVPTAPTELNNSSLNPMWGFEEALDIEWARASAPGAAIVMTFSPDPGPGLLYAVDWLVATHAVDVISMSWGEPLTGVFNAYSEPCDSACNASTDGTYAILDPVFEAAAAEGISLFAATGDCGAEAGTAGFTVEYPAADPFVTAVGGTVLRVASNGTYLGESAWNGTASGSVAPGCTNQGGSGGGFSDLPRPWWQLGLPNASGGRATPDVALDAATPASIAYQGSFVGGVGTSLGTPIWAGIAAIADQEAGRALGFLNPGLYGIYRSPNYSLAFHDILDGNNGYPAGTGWDPVTGLGTPIVSSLGVDLEGSLALPLHRPTTFVYASPRYGPAPLTVSFAVNASAGTGSFPVLGVNFGDGNSSLAGNATSHEYRSPGVYAVQGFAIDSGGNASASPPVTVVVGGGQALSVQLSASSLAPAAGAAVNLTVTASGGLTPYTFDFFFGDGTFLENQAGPTVVHAFDAPGSYCAEVVVRDAASPVNGAASPRLALAVGGAPAPDCGNASTPLTLIPNPAVQIRDAPAEFPSLFTSSGGTAAPAGLTNSFQYWSNDSYVRACQCTIFRTPGNYSVEAWENDTVNQEVAAGTNVTVTPKLVGDFQASALRGPAPLTVEFSVTVTGGYRADPATTQWNISTNVTQGTRAVGQDVALTFDLPGEYLVTGRLSDAGHGNTSQAFLLDVEGNGSNRAPGLAATISPALRVPSGTTVQYSGAIVGAPPGSDLRLYWSLGQMLPGPDDAYGPDANETYYAPLLPLDLGASAPLHNALDWGLAAVTANGTSVARVGGLGFYLGSFFAEEGGGFVPRASALTFHASLGPRTGPVPMATTGTLAAEGPGTKTANWSFGDGTGASGSLVNHTYTSSGTFTVRAEVDDSLGDYGVASFGTRVGPPLTVTGGPSVASGPAPLRVTFTARAFGGYGPPYSYSWTFGSGSPLNGSVLNRTFASPGTYVATVHVASTLGGAPVNRSWIVTVQSSGGIPAAALLAGSGAVGVAVGLLAMWAARRERRSSLPSPPSPRRPRAEGGAPRDA